MSTQPDTPQQAWDAMLDGNQRFVSGKLAHPRQDIDRREALAAAQKPFAALFGCSDSRLSAEIIFELFLPKSKCWQKEHYFKSSAG